MHIGDWENCFDTSMAVLLFLFSCLVILGGSDGWFGHPYSLWLYKAVGVLADLG